MKFPDRVQKRIRKLDVGVIEENGEIRVVDPDDYTIIATKRDRPDDWDGFLDRIEKQVNGHPSTDLYDTGR